MTKIEEIIKDLEHNAITFSVPMVSNPKQHIIFRALKTKDQKQLVITKDEIENNEVKNFDSILALLDNIIVKCPVPFAELEMVDFIWLLLNIRAKSVGEVIELVAKCKNTSLINGVSSCDAQNDLNLDIMKDNIMTVCNPDNVIKLNNNTIIALGKLNVQDFRNIIEYQFKDRPEVSMASSIKVVEFKGESVEIDLPAKLTIMGEFTKNILDKIANYMEESNKGIKLEKTIKCKNCGFESVYSFDTLEIINFF